MKKDFTFWHTSKAQIDHDRSRPFFHEREVWWCAVGVNVGFEQDGKGKNFSRPILILKKFNKEVFWCLPLTTKTKEGKYYAPITLKDKLVRKVILSQIRLLDAKRLQEKIDTVAAVEFQEIKKKIIQTLG